MNAVNSNKLLHFYMDEGGIFGKSAQVLITNKKLKPKKVESDISQYYKGKMPRHEIELYIDRFKYLFPRCAICRTESIFIDIRKRKKFPRKMMVSMNGKEWHERTVYAKIKLNEKLYIANYWPDAEYDPSSDKVFLMEQFRYAKEIE